MYIFGGYDGKVNVPSDIYEYDFKNKVFRLLPSSGDIPEPRSRSKLVSYNNKLAVFGGWDRTNYFNDYYEYDIDTGVWTKYPPIFNAGISQHNIIVKLSPIPRVYVFGGYYSDIKCAKNDLVCFFV